MATDDELADEVAAFLDAAEGVYDEYDDGYIDADAALSQLGDHLSTLRDAYEGDEA